MVQGRPDIQMSMFKINKILQCTAQGTQPIIYSNFKRITTHKNIEPLCCTPETNIKIVSQPYSDLEKKFHKSQVTFPV